MGALVLALLIRARPVIGLANETPVPEFAVEQADLKREGGLRVQSGERRGGGGQRLFVGVLPLPSRNLQDLGDVADHVGVAVWPLAVDRRGTELAVIPAD